MISLTLPAPTFLEQSMKPWKLRVDWLCHEAYGNAVVVELHVMGEEPKVLRRFSSAPEAVGWARHFIENRGWAFWCDVDGHQRRNDTHLTMHAVTQKAANGPEGPLPTDPHHSQPSVSEPPTLLGPECDG